jgi:hypothetical protein
MTKPLYYLLPLLVLCLFSCKKQKALELPVLELELKSYLHLSHTRTNSNPLMDSVAEKINYHKFDMLWLGGDLAHLTSKDEETMTRVDSLFDIRNTNTLWALGNHDYTDLDRVEQYTNRPPFYAFHQDEITFIVLDTQDSLSNIIGAQKDFVMGVLDTIQESTHLILLHHKLIWMYDNIILEPQISSIANGGLGDCFYCINPNNFNSEIYPNLVEVEERGVEVLCIGGDIGFKVNEFEYLSPEGIQFLASGIYSGEEGNKALLFQHDLNNNILTWDFILLRKL